MKVSITVKDRQEAHAVQAAMADPETRAFVITMGTLLPLPSDQSRRRVLAYVADKLSEEPELRAEDV